ncbi:MAG: SapC family protein [Alphaproteobacteria bacterium]|nr:MAG: SapC family protein [Alphaproteobacteria bacterium]
MASQPPATPSLPLFYAGLEPLSSSQHSNYRVRERTAAPHLANVHAIPLTSDEFVSAQRFYPIVFSSGENSAPLRLMGLNERVNVFFDQDGNTLGETYVPAYARRYPFMLARLRPEADELSLCFDPTSDIIGPFEDGTPLFEDGKPGEGVNAILKFCEEFEMSANRTGFFMKELIDNDLLMEGEVTIQPTGSDQPFIYRGFQMVNEEKFRELRGDVLRKMNQNGMLALIYAHLYSLQLIREVFGRQLQQQKGPALDPAAAAALGQG